MESIKPYTKILKQLECFKNTRILVSTEDIGPWGRCLRNPPIEGFDYWIKISPSSMRPLTVFHEFCHVNQFESGRLSVVGDEYAFHGTVYPKATPWHRRPWEVEATAVAEIVKWRFKTENFEGLEKVFSTGGQIK